MAVNPARSFRRHQTVTERVVKRDGSLPPLSRFKRIGVRGPARASPLNVGTSVVTFAGLGSFENLDELTARRIGEPFAGKAPRAVRPVHGTMVTRTLHQQCKQHETRIDDEDDPDDGVAQNDLNGSDRQDGGAQTDHAVPHGHGASSGASVTAVP